MPRFNLKNLAYALVIAIGIAMVILMTSIRIEQAAGKARGYTRDIILCQIARDNGLAMPDRCVNVLERAKELDG